MNEEETQRFQAAVSIMQDVVDRCPPKDGSAQTDGEQWRQRFTAWQIVFDAARQVMQRPAMTMEPDPGNNGTSPELVEVDG